MLPKKLRTAKIQEQILFPQGVGLWQAPVIAKGVYKTTLRWLEGKSEVTLDPLDIEILRKAGEHRRNGDPIVGFRPFRKGFCGDITTVSADYLRYLLGAR